jgi:hypothetical protein
MVFSFDQKKNPLAGASGEWVVGKSRLLNGYFTTLAPERICPQQVQTMTRQFWQQADMR